MKGFLETTLGKVILGALVVGVWGVNVINFSGMGNGGQMQSIKEVQNINLDELVIPKRNSYRYSSSSRDPFVSEHVVTPFDVEPSSSIQQENYMEPALQLTGIFDGMAVISDYFGQSYFVANGETFKDGIVVKQIVQDSVVLEYKNRNIVLKLN